VPKATNRIDEARTLIQRVFGYPDLREAQVPVIDAVLKGEDVLAILPTGGGKSMCYQLPALMRDGLTLVVSPLIALMRDQVAALQAQGVAAGALLSTNEAGENADLLRAARAGGLKLLYAAPERLLMDGFAESLRRVGVSLLAVDEAHCVSQWGHDFRREYMRLNEVRAALGGVQTLALTATADPTTREDIETRLFPNRPRTFVSSFDRSNIRLAMRSKKDQRGQLLDLIARHPEESGIVYCLSRKRTEEIAEDLSASGVKALAYHAGLEAKTRSRVQDRFQAEDDVIICATNAFGMGIDKPDVRFVAHADLPGSIEAWWQEVGRAGRDGLAADAVTMYGLGDITMRRRFIAEGDAPQDRKRLEYARLDALVALTAAPECRRVTLLRYFGETSAPCGNCDLCESGVKPVDATLEARKAASAVVRTRETFSTPHLISILRGDPTDPVLRWQHDKLPTFGVGKDHSEDHWRSVFLQMHAAGLLGMDFTQGGAWTLSDEGRAVMKGEAAFRMRPDAMMRKAEKTRRDTRAPKDALRMTGVDPDVLSSLKHWRSLAAAKARKPAYVLASDRTLEDIVRLRPKTLDDLKMCHGIGEKKAADIGPALLAALKAAEG
jgi:ATP-dependent DNA helicase RecQ